MNSVTDKLHTSLQALVYNPAVCIFLTTKSVHMWWWYCASHLFCSKVPKY